MDTLIIATIVVLLPTVLAAQKPEGFRSAMVASDNLVCSQAGRDILLKNGSAVDAAIATLLCLGVTIPESMGIGGGFLMTIYNKQKEQVEVLDAREIAPLAANKTMYDGKPNASEIGGLAVAVPGSIKGMEEAHKKYGVLKWHELFETAINVSENGFVVGKHLEDSIKQTAKKMEQFITLRELLWNKEKSRFYRQGDIMKNPKLSKTLARIAQDGPRAFYTGDLAKKLAQDIKDANGIVTQKDLEWYQAKWRSPIQVNMPGSLTINTFPLPGSGALLAFMLNIMKGFETNYKMTTGEEILYYHRVIETFKYTYARRLKLEDSESPSVKDLMELLTSERYAESIRNKVIDNVTFSDPMHYEMVGEHAKNAVFDDRGTSHLSVVAENGDAVSVTSTINFFFGSLVVSPSTGILLNNEMDDFSVPNRNNSFGVPPTEANGIHPGRRPLSSMVPSIFLDENEDVKLVIGASGGTKITTSVAQVIMSNLWLRRNITTAISEPRLHNQLFPIETDAEYNFPMYIKYGLEAIGHQVETLSTKMDSGVVAIVRESDGLLYGSTDPRKGGGVAGY